MFGIGEAMIEVFILIGFANTERTTRELLIVLQVVVNKTSEEKQPPYRKFRAFRIRPGRSMQNQSKGVLLLGLE